MNIHDSIMAALVAAQIFVGVPMAISGCAASAPGQEASATTSAPLTVFQGETRPATVTQAVDDKPELVETGTVASTRRAPTPTVIPEKQLMNKRLNPGYYEVVALLPDRGKTPAVDLVFWGDVTGEVSVTASKVLMNDVTYRGRHYTINTLLGAPQLNKRLNKSTVVSEVTYLGEAKTGNTTTVVKIIARNGGTKNGPHAFVTVSGRVYPNS